MNSKQETLQQQLTAQPPRDSNLYFQMADRTSLRCSQAMTRLIWIDKQRPQTVH